MNTYLIVYIDPYNAVITRNTRIQLEYLEYPSIIYALKERYLAEYYVLGRDKEFIILNIIKLD